MKYKVFISVIFAITMVVANSSMLAYKPASIHGPKFIANRTITTILKGKLKKAVTLIETNGAGSFSTIAKMNTNLKEKHGIFVIDPETGQLLVSPPKKTLGEYPLISKELNGKVLAREIIKNELVRKNESFINILKHAYGLVYKNYFSKLAITPDGKLYIVAIARDSATMQKLFVVEVVNKACTLIENEGIKEAISIFTRSDSLFRFEDTYVYVYGAGKANKGVQLCNPNYPKFDGKNMLSEQSELMADVKKMYTLLENKKKGWFKDMVKDPMTGKQENKEMYAQKINVEGTSYIVGSGVYTKK